MNNIQDINLAQSEINPQLEYDLSIIFYYMADVS